MAFFSFGESLTEVSLEPTAYTTNGLGQHERVRRGRSHSRSSKMLGAHSPAAGCCSSSHVLVSSQSPRPKDKAANIMVVLYIPMLGKGLIHKGVSISNYTVAHTCTKFILEAEDEAEAVVLTSELKLVLPLGPEDGHQFQHPRHYDQTSASSPSEE